MQHDRQDVFLATTSRNCTRDGAFRDIERSLKLMTTDHLDPHSFTDELLPFAPEKQMGIIGVKIAVRGRILSS